MTDGFKALTLKELKPTLVLHIPTPPSVNSLYATNFKTRRRFESKDYEQWRNAAGWELKPQLVGKPRPCVPGPVCVVYEYGAHADKRRRDVANLEKAASDLLVAHQVIEDDCLINEITLRWVDDLPPRQTRITITKAP